MRVKVSWLVFCIIVCYCSGSEAGEPDDVRVRCVRQRTS